MEIDFKTFKQKIYRRKGIELAPVYSIEINSNKGELIYLNYPEDTVWCSRFHNYMIKDKFDWVYDRKKIVKIDGKQVQNKDWVNSVSSYKYLSIKKDFTVFGFLCTHNLKIKTPNPIEVLSAKIDEILDDLKIKNLKYKSIGELQIHEYIYICLAAQFLENKNIMFICEFFDCKNFKHLTNPKTEMYNLLTNLKFLSHKKNLKIIVDYIEIDYQAFLLFDKFFLFKYEDLVYCGNVMTAKEDLETYTELSFDRFDLETFLIVRSIKKINKRNRFKHKSFKNCRIFENKILKLSKIRPDNIIILPEEL